MWLFEFLKPKVRTGPTAEYRRKVFYPVGAGNAAYHPAPPIVPAMIPMINFSGNGVLYPHSPNPIYGPQVYAHPTYVVAGIGGPLAGQVIHQPLNVPETSQGGQ